MRILLIGPYPAVLGRPIGGVQAALENLAGGLFRLGEEVVVMDPFTGHKAATEAPYEVIRLPPLPSWRLGLAGAPKYVADAVREASPEVLHVHLGAQYTRLSSRSVLTVHGFPHVESRLRNPGVRSRVSAAILRRPFLKGLAAAGQVISIAPEVAQLAEQMGVPSVSIPNPVAQEFFDVVRRPGSDFVSVGDIMLRKNQKLLIDAFVEYVVSGGYGNLVLVGDVGDQEYFEACRESAARVGGRVRFVGPQPRAAVAQLFAGAKAAVSTSLRETSSIALAEALAANCPVLSLDVGTARTQVCRHQDGVVLPQSARIRDVSAAMMGLAKQAATANGPRQAVLEQHPLTIAGRTLAVYNRVASAGA